LVALLIAGLSYWGPWVNHDAAALRLSGQDMGEFVKFLPASGQTLESKPPSRVPRELFYIPPFVCAVCLTLLAANTLLVYPGWFRVLALGCATLLLLGLLPPVWGHPKELFTGEFRLQGYGLLLGLVLILGHGLFSRTSLCLAALAVSVLSLLALIAAQGAFWHVYPRLWAAYNTPTLSLGWGLWLHTAAWAATIGLGIYVWQKARIQHAKIRHAIVHK
jgi:hypothetical protein